MQARRWGQEGSIGMTTGPKFEKYDGNEFSLD
jgi:hypothetical protein